MAGARPRPAGSRAATPFRLIRLFNPSPPLKGTAAKSEATRGMGDLWPASCKLTRRDPPPIGYVGCLPREGGVLLQPGLAEPPER